MKQLIFSIVVLTSYTLSQEYQITNVPVIEYSIDRYTNEIYYKNDITGDIYKTNSTGTNHSLTEFSSVPLFSSNSHTAAYVSNHNLYLHDFEKDTSYFLANHPYIIPYLQFSPSENKILCGGYDGTYVVYYSFEDSSIHNTGIIIYPEVMDWLSDTSIVYISLGEMDIRTLNINDLSMDTLVIYSNSVSIRGLATNINIGTFAYGWDYNTAENAYINLYYPQSGVDTTVYNFLEQGPGQEDFRIIIRDLTWAKTTNKLAFIGAAPLQYLSLVYIYDYNSFGTNLYSDPRTNGDGFKHNLQWLNKDTVVYSDYYDGGHLFGLDVTTPVSVKEDNNTEPIITETKLYQSFPNPFNPTTKIIYEIPSAETHRDASLQVKLIVYDVLGKEVATLVNEEKQPGIYEIEFDGTNFPSGVYFCQLKAENYIKTIKMLLLK